MKIPLLFRKRADESEWLGTRNALPHEVRDGDAVFRPEVILWLELPSGILVGSTLVDPRKPVSFAGSLEEAMKSPAEGPPRRPARVRVADAGLAEELRGAVGGMTVVVAPVPELDDVLAGLGEAMDAVPPVPEIPGQGEAGPVVVGPFFAAAEILARTAPWRQLYDDQVLRVDIPALGVEGGCLSVIGARGESFGLLLFRSAAEYLAFGNGLARRRGDGELSLRSLTFDRKKDVPREVVREIERRGWPVAGPKAYPSLLCLDGMDRLPPTGRDYRIMTACTRAFVAFFARHRSVFESNDPDLVRESSTGDDGVTVTLTAPYGDAPSFEDFIDDGFDGEVRLVNEPVRAAPTVGRNEPCPCGSGKKYKKCHLEADQASRSNASRAETAHEMDFRLREALQRFAYRRFGPEWLGVDPDAENDEDLLPLLMPWASWTAAVDGRRVADAFAEQERLTAEEREWIAAQGRAWPSVWEVTGVEPGTVAVRDLLTGERRPVREELGSRSLVARDCVLGRIADFRGLSLFVGMHARALPPTEAAEVVRVVRSKLRARTGDVAAGRLRDRDIGRFLMDRWTDAVSEHDRRRSMPPVLQNTDGDALLFVTDSLKLDAAVLPELERRLEALDGLDSNRTEDEERTFVYVDPQGTVVGRVIVGPDALRIETNSENRADALARRVRDACTGMLRDAQRSVQDPRELAKTVGAEVTKPAETSPENAALVRAYKEQHYRGWLDVPLPALGGKTPRAAARSKKSREQLDLLLRDMENMESRTEEGARFDMRRLRQELGLGE